MFRTVTAGFVAALFASGVVSAASPDSPAPMYDVAAPDFVKAVSGSNAFEIQSSVLAQKKSQSQDVKAFAAQMIADHTKAQADLKAAASSPPSDELAPKQAAMNKLLE